MPLQLSVRASKKPRLNDEVRFLRSWIEKPLHMGAVMPSGRLLARTMAHYVDLESEGPVVELGPGTGAITSALVERGIDQRRLVLVEFNPGFCAYPSAAADFWTISASEIILVFSVTAEQPSNVMVIPMPANFKMEIYPFMPISKDSRLTTVQTVTPRAIHYVAPKR